MGGLNVKFPNQINLPDGIVASQIPLTKDYVNDNVRYAFTKGGMNIGSAQFTYDDVNNMYRPTAFVGVQINEKFRGKGVYSSLVKSMGKHFPVGSSATEYTPKGEVMHTAPSAARAWQRAGASKKAVLPNPKLANSWVKEIYVISPSDYLSRTPISGILTMADAYEDPAMKKAYESTGESMRKISGATKSGGKGQRSSRARKQAREILKLRKALETAKVGVRGASRFGGIPGFLAGTVLSAAAFPILERLMYGSREDQMREQFETQKKLEQEEMAKMGGVSPMGDMGGVAGGMMPQQEQGMYDLLEDKRQTGEDVSFARQQNRALEGLGRSGSGDELDRLLAGQEARIRSIQSPRQLTPYEIMGIIGG
jgi:hypothetical protein